MVVATTATSARLLHKAVSSLAKRDDGSLSFATLDVELFRCVIKTGHTMNEMNEMMEEGHPPLHSTGGVERLHSHLFLSPLFSSFLFSTSQAHATGIPTTADATFLAAIVTLTGGGVTKSGIALITSQYLNGMVASRQSTCTGSMRNTAN